MTVSLFTDEAEGRRLEVESPEELAEVVGRNLRRLRTRRGLSLERLAQASGVSRAMLGQIELGRSMPTIGVLWKIARSLEIPINVFTALQGGRTIAILRAGNSKVLVSADGTAQSRALFPMEQSRRVEFYEIRLEAGAEQRLPGLAVGSIKNLVVIEGHLEVTVASRIVALSAGDAAQFLAEEGHVLANRGSKVVRFHLVVTLGTWE